jgi:hypothetical protein
MDNEQNKTEQKRDESLVGGYYHGPSNEAGLTAREYDEMMMQYYNELDDLRADAY